MPNPVVTLETNKGNIVIELDAGKAQLTVANFTEYANAGHYNGLIFHRVIPGFMIQGGGYDLAMRERPTRGPIRNEAGNGLKNRRGTIAMARTGEVHSATAQFFINLVDNDFLDHSNETPQGFGYAVFGQVTSGMDVVDAIARTPVKRVGGHEAVPQTPIAIKKASIA